LSRLCCAAADSEISALRRDGIAAMEAAVTELQLNCGSPENYAHYTPRMPTLQPIYPKESCLCKITGSTPRLCYGATRGAHGCKQFTHCSGEKVPTSKR
jgi:hypothetical protein